MSSIIGGKKETQSQVTSNVSDQNLKRFSEFRPQDVAALNSAQQAAFEGAQGLSNFFTKLQQQAAAEQPFQFTGPDAITRALASQATQGLAQQAGIQQQRVAQQFQNNPAASRALQAQIAMQSRLASNPNLFNAYQGQLQRQLQELGARQGQRTEQMNFAPGMFGAGQQQLQNAMALANMFKTDIAQGQTTEQQQAKASARSGGILQNFGIK